MPETGDAKMLTHAGI